MSTTGCSNDTRGCCTSTTGCGNLWGVCGSGLYKTWQGCGASTRLGGSIDEVNRGAEQDGWLLVRRPDGHVEAFVCPACKAKYEEERS